MRNLLLILGCGLISAQTCFGEVRLEDSPKATDPKNQWTVEIKNNIQYPVRIKITDSNGTKIVEYSISAKGSASESSVRFADIDPSQELRFDFFDGFPAADNDQIPRASFVIKPLKTREHVFVKLEGKEQEPQKWRLVPQEGTSFKAKFTGVRYSTSGVDMRRNVTEPYIKRYTQNYQAEAVIKIDNKTGEQLTVVIEDDLTQELLKKEKVTSIIEPIFDNVSKINRILIFKGGDALGDFRINLQDTRPLNIFHVDIVKNKEGVISLTPKVTPDRRNILLKEIKARPLS